MCWSQMNHYELQAMRKLLMLDVKESAECIGKCSVRAWQLWEAGKNPVPDDVETEIYGLIGNRNLIINNAMTLDSDTGPLRYYKTLEAFVRDFPKSNAISWRLHQSVCAYLFAEGGEVELSEGIPLNTSNYIYQYFTQTRKEDIELAKQEAVFEARSIGE